MTGINYAVWRSIDYRPAIIDHPPTSLLEFVSPGETALEIGCGKGLACLFLARHGIRMFGIDLNPAAIKEARELARGEGLEAQASFKVGDFLREPLDRTFDLVVLIRILTCYPDLPAWESLLQRVHERLNTHGLIYVHDFVLATDIEQYRLRYEAGIAQGLRPGSFPVRDREGKLLFIAHHHSPEEIGRITGAYEVVGLKFHRSLSMNGNECKMFEFIGRKPK